MGSQMHYDDHFLWPGEACLYPKNGFNPGKKDN